MPATPVPSAPAAPTEPRRLLADRSVRTKLGAVVGLALIGLGAVTAVSVRAVDQLQTSNERLLRLSTLQKQLMDGDMAHDAVRGDVLQTVLFAGTPTRDSAADDLPDQVKTLQDAVQAAKTSGLGASTGHAVTAVEADLDAYGSSASQIVGLTL